MQGAGMDDDQLRLVQPQLAATPRRLRDVRRASQVHLLSLERLPHTGEYSARITPLKERGPFGGCKLHFLTLIFKWKGILLIHFHFLSHR